MQVLPMHRNQKKSTTYTYKFYNSIQMRSAIPCLFNYCTSCQCDQRFLLELFQILPFNLPSILLAKEFEKYTSEYKRRKTSICLSRGLKESKMFHQIVLCFLFLVKQEAECHSSAKKTTSLQLRNKFAYILTLVTEQVGTQ